MGKTGVCGGVKGTNFRYKINTSQDAVHSRVTIDNNSVLHLKVTKRIDLKHSHYGEKCNYVYKQNKRNKNSG